MNVVEAHNVFIRTHLDNRSGERRGRLERGHGHGEALFAKQIWWNLRGDFESIFTLNMRCLTGVGVLTLLILLGCQAL